ncbi:MAG: hypothetical protein SVV80_00755 [Planctomycetota bacterium]|nr:hypothetical protein [Planctomycetota bacterium]
MNDKQQEQFERELTEALAADDVSAELDELSRSYAGDAQAGQRIRETRRLASDLINIGEHLADKPVPAMAKSDLTARRIHPRWIAVPAAAAAAAALIIAVLLQSPPMPSSPAPGPAPGPVVLVASRPLAPADTWRVPSVTPVSLGGETFTIPNISIPSTSSMGIGWNVPSIPFDYPKRSINNET